MKIENYSNRISVKLICDEIYDKFYTLDNWEEEARKELKLWFAGQRKIDIFIEILKSEKYFNIKN